MPMNVTYEYEEAEKKYFQAETIPEKIRCLEEMLAKLPKHKGTEQKQREIKQRISRFKAQLEKEKKTKAGRRHTGIKKEGVAQIYVIGKTNSGKSTLLTKLTNAKLNIQEYEYTTVKPEIGIMEYSDMKIQLIEMPALQEDYIQKDKGALYLSYLRNADLIVLLVKSQEDVNFLIKELDKGNIVLNKDVSEESIVESLKAVALINNEEKIRIKKFESIYCDVRKEKNIKNIKDFLWNHLGLVFVYTKSPGKKKEMPPVALDIGSTVEDLALKVHKDFVNKFKYARIWGESVKHDGLSVGLEHELKSGDVVEFHVK